MKARIKRLSTSNRRKLTSILLAVVIFGLLTVLTTLALGRNPIYGVLNAIMVGTSVGLFEQFYIQRGGFWGAWAGGRAVILPKFLIVAALRAAYVHFGGLGWMTAIFYGVSLR
jgi:hypothetical protein